MNETILPEIEPAVVEQSDAEPGTSKLQQELQQRRPFGSLQEEAFLAMQRTAGLLMQGFARELRTRELTPAQYNVLRILRGASPDALTCSVIGARLVTPGPDVTRLVDRLVQRGLAERYRHAQDRRVVQVLITDDGLEILAALDQPVAEWIGGLLSPLEETELSRLIVLLAKLR